MKKILLSLFISIFVTISFTGQSWAFGWLHHHHSSGSIGPEYSGNRSSWDNSTDSNTESNDTIPWRSTHEPVADADDPTPSPSPVPEPVTLSLVGAGLVAFYLRRKIR